eukprot:CAMPEP_0194480232 /NCGR_PEP_ID=MMETSP0253-20130528/3104_1 /TAXON_ID=2966 /ORGANISM="Noctiluca scintillans" /LENGTH=50 /DNA_ID=CAMNT_0039319589 /DNA_START=38 /DNA_END=190 /DNA_ORIENTATION=+
MVPHPGEEKHEQPPQNERSQAADVRLQLRIHQGSRRAHLCWSVQSQQPQR